MNESISEDRLRNTRAWAAARIGQMSGAEVIVGAIDELLSLRQFSGLLDEAAHVLIEHEGKEIGEKWRQEWARRYEEISASQPETQS